MAKEKEKEEVAAVYYPPTPLVGMPIQWFRKGDPQHGTIAAVVTAIESPGRIKLAFTSPRCVVEHVEGCRHISDPEIKKNPRLCDRSGSWSYIPGFENKNATKYAEDIAQRQKEQRELQIKQSAERLAREQAELAELEKASA